MGAKADLSRWKSLVDEHMDAFYADELARRDYTSSFYRKIHSELADYSMRGKRLRALLLIIGYAGTIERDLTDEDLERLMPVCVGLELLHSHFLIHDDIVDRDDTRRGGPAMHRRLEEVTPRGAVTDRDFATVAGDLVLAQATKSLISANIPGAQLVAARQVMSDAMIETNIGKLYDLLDINQSLNRIEFEHILFVMTYRTSRYTIYMPLAMGAALAGSDDDPSRFDEFASMLGTAFHLYHDLSELEDSDAQIRTDIRENKKTVLLKWLYEAISEEDQDFFAGLMGTKVSTADYHKVTMLLREHGIIERAERYISELLTDADSEIEKLGFNQAGVDYLRHIMHALAGQEHIE